MTIEDAFVVVKFLPDDCAISGPVRYSSVSHTALHTYRHDLTSGHSATLGLFAGSPGRHIMALLFTSAWRKLRDMDRLKLLSLTSLVVQTALLALTTRYSRTQKHQDHRYLSSTAVVTSEVVKSLLCLLILGTTARKSFVSQLSSIANNRDIIRSCVPSFLYTLQNNLQFVAMNYLDAATFQITYQLKIITTAVFAVLLLRKRLDTIHWSALVMLAVGVAMVQFPTTVHCTNGPNWLCDMRVEGRGHGVVIGMSSVLVMCLSSGFAGVYTEKLLKSSTSDQSMWARNLQLAVTSSVIGLCYVYIHDGPAVMSQGFFHEYDAVTWSIIGQLAVLGLVVSLVMKHADNLIKGFASSIAIILTTVISALVLDDLSISYSFMLGTIVVLASVLLYNVDRKEDNSRPESVV